MKRSVIALALVVLLLCSSVSCALSEGASVLTANVTTAQTVPPATTAPKTLSNATTLSQTTTAAGTSAPTVTTTTGAPITSPVTTASPATTEKVEGSGGSDITVTEGGENVARAAAAGLRSAVSIYCTFTRTAAGSYWNPTPTTQTYYTMGSGVIYKLDADGSAYIITNYHVVYDSSSDTQNGVSDRITLYLYGMESDEYAISADYVGGSAYYDIAVLRVDGSEILRDAAASGSAAAVTVGNSDYVFPGDTTIAIGNPSTTGLSGISVTRGIVSVDSEYIEMTAADGSGSVAFRVIRTDTPINAGNSGGGFYNAKGELIGIVNAKIVSDDIESVGYAIPSSVARAVADNIIDHCYGTECESVMRVLLGITIGTKSLSTSYDPETGYLTRHETIYVSEITSGSIAEGILMANDLLVSITIGERTVTVTRQHHVIDAMLDARVGDTVSVTVLRDGIETTVTATITESCLTAY